MVNAFLFIWLWLSINQAAQPALRPIYDARLSPKSVETPAIVMAVVTHTVRPTAQKHWGQRNNCDDDFAVMDFAQGAFTRPQTKQRAVLYRYCSTGHNFALNGLAIIEAEQVVAHVVYEGSWENAIGALPDINGNGLSEILIATGGTNMGETWGVISIVELTSQGVKDFGLFDTYSDNCGVQPKGGRATAHRILAHGGDAPRFYQEIFTQSSCKGKTIWTKAKSVQPIAPRKSDVVYQRLK